MLSGIRAKVMAMPVLAVALSMVAGEVVKPADRIRTIVDRVLGGRY